MYAGRSSGDEVTVAIAVSGERAAAYLCDGKSVEAWLQGPVTGDRLMLTGRGAARLTASLTGAAVLGMLSTSTGQTWPFSAIRARRPAGVYQARVTLNGLATRIGWAVLPDGRQFGLRTAGGRTSPAPPLDLAASTFTVAGVAHPAAPVVGSDIVVDR